MLDSQKDELFLFFSTRGKKAKLFIILGSFAAQGETIWLSMGHYDVNTSS